MRHMEHIKGVPLRSEKSGSVSYLSGLFVYLMAAFPCQAESLTEENKLRRYWLRGAYLKLGIMDFINYGSLVNKSLCQVMGQMSDFEFISEQVISSHGIGL